MSAPPPPPPQNPPPGGYPPPGGGQPGPWNGPGKQGFDPKTVNPLDWAIVGAGVLAFIFSLFPYYTISADFGPAIGERSESATAWSGFFGWASTLLALAGAAAVAVTLFAPQVRLPKPGRLIGLGLFAAATLFVILASFLNGYDDGGLDQVDTGRGIGYWLSLIVIVAGLVLSLMRFQATGGQLPGKAGSKVPNIGHHGPQGGITGSQGQPGQYGQPGQGGQPGQYGTPPPPPQGGTPPPPPGYGPPQ
ncbi:hypothetical protein [Jatrophihabitans fulvus]